MSRHLLVCVVFLLFLGSPSSWAYIPPSEYILKQFSRKKAGVTSLRIRSQVVAIENGQPTAIRFRMMTQLDFPTNRAKTRVYDDAGKELYATTREMPVDATQVRRPGKSSVGPVFLLLVEPRVTILSALMKEQGIPVRTEEELLAMESEEKRREAELTKLARLEGKVAWLFKAARGGEFDPQLWVEKDVFLPLRFVAEGVEGRFDLRFEGYRAIRDVVFPKAIVVRQADASNRVLLQETLQDLWVNPEGNEMSRGFSGEGFTESGNLVSGTIRDFVVRSLKILR